MSDQETYILHPEDPSVHALLRRGHIGLEKESLRVTPDGFLAQTPDPFAGDPYIVKDFCENQTEVNTPVCDSVEAVIEQLQTFTDRIKRTLAELPEPELLWPFSNPPYIRHESKIPIAQYEGKDHHKQVYREYLAERYGRYKMTFSGIHFNYSFDEELIRTNHEHYKSMPYKAYRNAFYIALAAKAQTYNWLVVALTAASPLLDSSYVEKGVYGRDIFNGMGSTRCSELGYWNFFTPMLDYSHISNYAESILSYIERGLIRSAAELYFPVRLKSFDEYSPCSLCEEGVSHIELRMIDLNPLTPAGIDPRDVLFLQLYLIWLASVPARPLTSADQVMAIQNTKNAARYDLKTVTVLTPDGRSLRVTEAAEELLNEMQDFYEKWSDDPEIHDAIQFQLDKIEDADRRYAWQIRERFHDGFVEKGLEIC